MIFPGDIEGGQFWEQIDHPYHKRYVVGARDGFILVSDPLESVGNVCTDRDGKWIFTPEELAEKFNRFKYRCRGQFIDYLYEMR
jgi:hypothetical protein